MKKLTLDNFTKAKAYLFNHGRELEQKMFEFEFEHGSAESVIEALEKHQNSDGGFKNMGEGDRNCSSPIGTSVAFQYLVEVGATSSEKLVQQGIQYFLDSYNRELNYWQPDTERSYDSEADRLQGWGNPSAEIVGYLHLYSQLVPNDFLQKVTDIALYNLKSMERPLDWFSVLCFLRMSHCTKEPIKSFIIERFKGEVENIIEKNSEKWTSYCAKPFWYATSPKSPLFEPIREYVLQSLYYEIDTQAVDGHFILNWDVTGESERTWKSIWTWDTLKALKQHGLIEGIV